MNNIHGFYEKDLTFLFKSKSMEEINNKINELQKGSKTKLTDYEILDKLSNGRGTEAYQKLSQYRLQSKEYYSAFQFFTNKKMMDLKTKEGLNMHVFRNKNQYKKAPHDLKTMMKFVKAGYFIYEGYSPCHNVPHDQDTYEYRKKTLQLMIYCVRHNLLKKRNKWSQLGNISFRGRSNTSFEGCQFIYNDKTGKLVVDCHNRGTWDYGKHGTSAHFLYDINPWLNYGNGINKETEDMFLMDEKTEKEYLKSNNDILNNLMNQESDDVKSTWENCMAFLKDIIDSKGGKSVEDLCAPVVDPEVYIQEEKDRVNAMRLQYIDEFIDKNAYRLETAYQPDYDKYKAFYTLVSSREFIDHYISDYKEMIVSGELTSSKQAYNEFIGNLMRETLMNGAGEVNEGDKVDMKLGNYELSFSSEYIDNMNQKLQNHPVAKSVINDEHIQYIDLITDLMNGAADQFGMEFRLLDNDLEGYSKAMFTVKMVHTVTKEETIILGKKNFTRGISDEDKPLYNETVLEEEATENLNTYHTPEYLL